MSTKVTITADGSQAKQEAREVAGAMDRIGQESIDASNRAADALERIEEHLEDVASQARRTDNAMEKIGGGGMAGKITAVATSFTAVGQALELGGQAAQGALNAINFLADSGSPAATRLRDSISGVQDALVKLADDPRVQELGDQLAGMGNKAAEGIAELPGLWTQTVNGLADAIAGGMEMVGLAAAGTTATLDEMQAAEARALGVAKERIAAERERLEVERQKTELAKGMREIEEASNSASRQALLQKISDQNEILKLIYEQQAALNSAASAGKLNDEDRATGLKHLAELESRLQGIRREGEQAAKAEADKAVADQKKRDAEVAESHKRMREDQLAADQAARDERERAERESIDRQKKGMEGSGAAAGINQQAADPQAIARRLAQQAADARRNELMAGGEQDAGKLDREAEEARRQAHRAAIQQSRGGRQAFNQEQVSGAIEANAQAQIQGMSQTGQFSSTALQALSESAAEQRRMSTEMRAMQDQLKQIQQFQGQTTQDGNRRRSQRNSSRQ